MKKVFLLLILSLSVHLIYGQMDSLFYYPDKNWKELASPNDSSRIDLTNSFPECYKEIFFKR